MPHILAIISTLLMSANADNTAVNSQITDAIEQADALETEGRERTNGSAVTCGRELDVFKLDK